VAVGHDLKPCNSEIQAFRCRHADGSGRNIVLVDTPGFDDADIKDTDVLESIAQWLAETYRSSHDLSVPFN
jgi:predicted GTPase